MLSLSFLVVIHELGHFTFARIFKVRVEKFYMFFNPVFSIFRAKKVGGKWRFRFFARNVESNMIDMKDENGNPVLDRKGRPLQRPMTDQELAELPADDWRRDPQNTEWGIGWLPVGGYCAIAGMVDETTSAGELATEPQPWEYRSKPTYQRLPIIIGGVLVNFIAALVIYSLLMFNYGEEYMSLSNATYGMQFSEVMQEEGFVNGDKILTINGQVPETTKDVVEWAIVEGKHEFVVARPKAGSVSTYDTITITLSDDIDQKILASGTGMMDYRYPFVVDRLMDGGAAAQALMQAGDSVIGVNDVPTMSVQDVQAQLRLHPCETVDIHFVRAGEQMTAQLFLSDEGLMGVYMKSPYEFLETTKKEYGFWESIPAGIKHGWEVLVSYVKQFKLVFTREGAKSLGGFGSIGSLFPSVWDWSAFWNMTAFLSIILAFMNIIPIPALDGGYVLMLLWEMITRRKPSDRFLEIANNIGFWLLMALIIYANFNDVFKFFIK